MPHAEQPPVETADSILDLRVLLAAAVMVAGGVAVVVFPDVVPFAVIWMAVIFTAVVKGPRVVALLSLLGLAISLAAGLASGLGGSWVFWGRMGVFVVIAVVSVVLSLRRARRELNLWILATTDELTGLPNRRLLVARLEAQLAIRNLEKDCAVIYADLNDFKEINDRHGHLVGDQVLVLTAQRLARCFRAADTVARFGGDEFVVAVPAIDGREGVTVLCERMLAAFDEPLHIGTTRVDLRITIGAAIAHPSQVVSPVQLIERADDVLIELKRTGETPYRIVDW
ncbi:MAG: GGDEF domain-containing protein [Candidatus Nanopelagicales bacterium]|nr:GGDEF domain-containing protein [Candidatus Nanopelagicales bacterium]